MTYTRTELERGRKAYEAWQRVMEKSARYTSVPWWRLSVVEQEAWVRAAEASRTMGAAT